MRFPLLALVGIMGLAVLAPSRQASACGACFTTPPEQGSQVPSLVTSHRMALSISTTQTVLWDQIRYSGSPSEFAWVLPVKPGTRVEVATDAWFDVLEAATSPLVMPPELDCAAGPNCSVSGPIIARGTSGCSADDGAASPLVPTDDGVDVVSHGSAGPYEAVILHPDDPDALPKWLASHGYVLPDEMGPVVSAYAKEGFDFVALRLLPSAGIQQMRPIRVVMPGAVPALPLRMVAGGTGASTAITLFVIGEGRWRVGNFPEAAFSSSVLTWDFDDSSTNYAEIRESLLAKDGRSFFTEYAQQGALFSAVDNPYTDTERSYSTSNGWRNFTIADAYVEQGFLNGESSSTDCGAGMSGYAFDSRRVVDPCVDGECVAVDPREEIDARDLMCDPPLGSDLPLDDLAMALVGSHPSEVWVTRLEARLGRAAFADDLELVPADTQVEHPAIYQAAIAKNAPCDLAATPVRSDDATRRPSAPWGIGVGLGVVALLAALRRGRSRRLALLAEVSR